VKKSIAAITSRWFLKNVIQLWRRSGRRKRVRRYRDTLRLETMNPSRSNSP
jgi:hypothetical protein